MFIARALSAIVAGAVSTTALAQVPIGDELVCRQTVALRGADNVYDPDLGDVFTDEVFRVFALGDLNADDTPDLLVVEYYLDSHYAAVACGATGDVLYGLESVGAADYWFAVDAMAIGDADLDGVPDFILVSHDGFLGVADVLILSGADGKGIARLDASSTDPDEVQIVPTLFNDVDKSGIAGPDDVYIVIQSATATEAEPVADLNLDGVIDHLDVALAGAQSGAISPSTVASLAVALGGTHIGTTIVVSDSSEGPNPGILDGSGSYTAA